MSVKPREPPYDNSMAESFFATLECELLDQHRFRNHTGAIFEWIECWSRYAGDPSSVVGARSGWLMWSFRRVLSDPMLVRGSA